MGDSKIHYGKRTEEDEKNLENYKKSICLLYGLLYKCWHEHENELDKTRVLNEVGQIIYDFLGEIK